MFRVNTARLSQDNLHAHKRIVKMLISIIIIFALFGLPGQIMWLLPVVTTIDNNSNYYSILSLVDIFNYMYCVLNPVLFFAYNSECYQKLKKCLSPVFSCCGCSWESSSQIRGFREAGTTLLPPSRTSDSQDTSGSDGVRVDPKFAPTTPEYLREKLDESTTDRKQHNVPTALISTLAGLYAPFFGGHADGFDGVTQAPSQGFQLGGDEKIFRGSFVELLRAKNLNNDLFRRLEESPETAIVEQGGTEEDQKL